MSLPKASIYRLLPTEQPNPRARHIDRDPTATIVRKMNQEDRKVAVAVGREGKNIVRAVELISRRLRDGGRVFLAGAGTSGRLCVMEAAECPPTFGIAPSRIQAFMAGGNRSVFRAREGAEDDFKDGERRASSRVSEGDVVIGVAASGVTPFVSGALRAAKKKKCGSILITSNAKPLMRDADIIICPNVGPELIAGSTRLKSATAAKLVLNTLTTASMVRLGKIYDGWMVDLRLTSRKTRLRAVRIVCRLGKVGPGVAQSLLKHAGGSVKIAVLAARVRLGNAAERAGKARRLLDASGGSLAAALDRLALAR